MTSQVGSRRLKCLINGESIVFPVTVEHDCEVGDLKIVIQRERRLDTLKDVGPHILELWKPKNRIACMPADTLLERTTFIRNKLSKFADQLDSSDSIFRIFSTQPPVDCIHIIVKIPSTGGGLLAADAGFLAIYQSFWLCGGDRFVKHCVQIPDSSSSDGNLETLELVVISLPKESETAFTTQVSKLLVIPIYETFWDILENEDRLWQDHLKAKLPRFAEISHATIITGQPGVGKSVFLIYVLLRRLVNGMTTIYCDGNNYVHIFDDNGVRKFALPARIPELDNNSKCCALVNLGDKLTHVPEVFYPQHRIGRVVVASSPNKNHWANFSREHPARICCMPTWEWGPLYFASLLFASKDLETLDLAHCKALQDTYSIFRGIPRSCFLSLNPRFLDVQKTNIMDALNSGTFLNDFSHVLTGPIPFNTTISHCLVRVEPVDAGWTATRTEIKSNYIAELVFERIRLITKAGFSSKLMEYLTDNSLHGAAGVLFEQATHYSIRKGLTLTITSLRDGETLDVSIPGIPVEKIEKSRYYSLSIWEKPRSQNVHPDFLDLYMTPKSKNEPSIDALFISSEYVTYLFQITVSSRHPIKFQRLDMVFNKLPARAQKDVRIVFIIPAEGPSGEYQGIGSVQSIDTPQKADADKVKKFNQLSQYVCRLDTTKIGWV